MSEENPIIVFIRSLDEAAKIRAQNEMWGYDRRLANGYSEEKLEYRVSIYSLWADYGEKHVDVKAETLELAFQKARDDFKRINQRSDVQGIYAVGVYHGGYIYYLEKKHYEHLLSPMSSSFDNNYIVTGPEDVIKRFADSKRNHVGHLSNNSQPEKEEPGRLEYYTAWQNRPDIELTYRHSLDNPELLFRCVFSSAEAGTIGVFTMQNGEMFYENKDVDFRPGMGRVIPIEWWTTYIPTNKANPRYEEKIEIRKVFKW